ncbi:tyrosine-type recombinase/integrase [Pantanalinema sp. GBBB05]|uniref:tyrosine-type recombinase/integrase n=1 Tax=Pantanalinema sp. GBBB05 TaxID=2604139 RepID=UPI001D9F3E09|nr:tyrosine-type recombinase/integrase [Pantanalinema sp. GBBB05]
MKVQRVQLPEDQGITWVVLGNDYLPVQPITEFLTYMRNLEYSPNTIRAYANHLRLYWEYLQDAQLDWQTIGKTELAAFIGWLRSPQANTVSIQEQESKRTEVTVNTILTAVCMFYEYHEQTGEFDHVPLYKTQMQPGRRYKSFLHHINKSKPVKTRLLKLKEPKRQVKTLTQEQVKTLIDTCKHLRDKFLICLLHETGMRIGQALGLQHEDVRSWDNQIQVVPRNDNPNGARAKSREAYTIDVTSDLMSLYTDYFLKECGDVDSVFVFVNLWDGEVGEPMTYNAIADLFNRLSKKVGFHVTPHMLRHTHATELIRGGWDAAYVQKRLGHRQVQTVINTYTHLTNDDMKNAFKDYLEKQGRLPDETTTEPIE